MFTSKNALNRFHVIRNLSARCSRRLFGRLGDGLATSVQLVSITKQRIARWWRHRPKMIVSSFALATVSAPPGSQLRFWRSLGVRVMRLLDEVVGTGSCLSGRRQKEARFRESLP